MPPPLLTVGQRVCKFKGVSEEILRVDISASQFCIGILGANLWSMGKNCPRPMCVPNLKIVAFSVCEILRGSQNFEIGSRTPGHAHLGANLWSGGKNCPRPMCVPNLKIVALPVCEILRGSQNFEIGARAAGDAQFRANLWCVGKNCPRPMCVPNLRNTNSARKVQKSNRLLLAE